MINKIYKLTTNHHNKIFFCNSSQFSGSSKSSCVNKVNGFSFFNSNKKPVVQQPQLKGNGRNNPAQNYSQKPLDSIILPYPFEFTLQSNNFKYYDPRFTEYPIKKILESGQKQHLIYVLENLQAYINAGYVSNFQNKALNKGCSPDVFKNYLHQSFSSKLPTFVESLKQTELSIKIHIDKNSITKTQGYMEYQTKNLQQSTSIDFLKPKYLHEYAFQREKQLLLISELKNKTKKSQQELLKNDVHEMLDQKSQKKQVRQFFDQIQKSKTSDSDRAVNFLMSKLKGLATKKALKRRQQQSFLTSQVIQGKVFCEVYYKNKLVAQNSTELYTKWMYLVEKNEPQSIKKSRKRVLYDFQFWNRGSFFRVKDWVQELSP